ncbi:uncharacterized protein PAC_14919 [Phialocephala subalpina]|uniref:Uncharacterized protein n=1 Tax=Phialocephala subalpina TaxID=576137 RepID=A0A1L7XIZ8_9HELO|nr:uncharacterized protein PAC_14919 [Phialocephala subalpina]
MYSKFMDSSTHIDRPDDKSTRSNSPSDNNKSPSTQSNETTRAENGKGKSPEQAQPKIPSPNSKSKVTIEDFNSADENDDHPASPTNNIKVNIVKSKKHNPHADPDDEKKHGRRKITYTGVSTLYMNPAQIKAAKFLPTPASKTKNDDENEKSPLTSTSSNDTKVDSSETVKVASPSPETIKITLSSHDPKPFKFEIEPYEKTTFKTALSVPLDSTFTIPVIDTRESLMLTTMDLAARYDNHYRFIQHSNSLLRQEAEDKTRKVEELDWKVKCFQEEDLRNKKDRNVLEGKMKDLNLRLTEAGKEVKQGKREVFGEKFERERLEKELATRVEELLGMEKGNEKLREQVEVLKSKGDFVCGDAEEEMARLRDMVEDREKDLRGLRGDLSGAEDENTGLKERFVELENRFAEETMKLIDREERVSMLEQKVEELQESNGECEMNRDGLRGKLDDARDENRGLEKMVERLEVEKAQLEKDGRGAGKDAVALEERVEVLQKENAGLSKANSDLEMEVLRFRNVHHRLRPFFKELLGHIVNGRTDFTLALILPSQHPDKERKTTFGQDRSIFLGNNVINDDNALHLLLASCTSTHTSRQGKAPVLPVLQPLA